MNNSSESDDSAAVSNVSLKTMVSWGMILCVAVIVATYLSRPLYDPDFYWHLKTGQWIWQNKALPMTDPFGIPPLPDSSPRNMFILTSYWLIQLVLHACHSIAGMSGIIIFRWIVAGICILAISRWSDLRNSAVTAVLATGVILLLELYFIERPQFISFICFGALLIGLFRFTEERNEVRSLWGLLLPLALVMVLWANMHGGFLIGQAILIYFMVAEGIKFLHSSLAPMSRKKYTLFLISLTTALAASCINPNAFNMIKYLPIIFDADNYVNLHVLEQLSLTAYFRETGDYTVLLYMASILLTACALLVSRQRTNITWVGVLAGTAYMGSQHMRLMPFFLVTSLLFLTGFFRTGGSGIKSRIVLIAMLIVTTAVCLGDEFSRLFKEPRSAWVPTSQYPVQAVDFITSNKISGNIYTTLYWGGYMLWRTGPESKTFHDGRFLNIQRAWEYNNSLNIAQNQRPYWKGLMNVHNIRLMVLPIYDDNGSPNLLAQSVAADKEWKLIHASENEAVFMKN